MAPSPPPTGLLHQNSGTNILGGTLPTRLVTEDTPPDMLAGSMDLRVTLPNKHTVKMSVERSTPMMDLLVHITTAHKVSPGGHVLQAIGERGVLPYKPSTPIGALDTWSIYVVPRHQAGLTPSQALSGSNKRAPPKPLALQSQQPFEQTFRLQVRLPRNQLFVARLSPRTPLSDILDHVCREKNLDPAKYELRHPVHTDQALQVSLSLADYRVTEVAVVPRGSRTPTELSSSDLQTLDSTQRATSTGSAGGGATFANMLKRTTSGGTNKEGGSSVSGDSLGGRSSSPARSDESAGRSVSPPGVAPQQPPPPPRHRKGRAPKPPPTQPTQVSSSAVEASSSAEKAAAAAAASSEDRTLVIISHSRNSSDSSGYHEASVLSDSPDNLHGRGRLESPPDTLARDKPSKPHKQQQQQHKQFSRSMLNLTSEASTSSSQQLNNLHSASTTSLANKKKRAPPPPPTIPEPDTLSSPSSIVLEPESTDEKEKAMKDNDDDSVGEDDLDSAFQSVTDVLEEQLRAEAEQKAQLDLLEEERVAREAEERRLAELELLRAEKERKKVEQERKEFEEERARLAQEREELGRQRREQQVLEAELRERLQRELEQKQRQIQEEQRKEIERLQREQEELERELKEREQEKAERMKLKESSIATQIVERETVVAEIPDWEYKLPAPPSAFRDKQLHINNQQNEDERRNSDASSNSDQNADIEVKNKINAMLEYASNSDEESDSRPKPPEVVEVRVKAVETTQKRSMSPPRVSVVPLRSAHSLYSLVHEEPADVATVKTTQPLRKTSSVADVSKDVDDEVRLQQLQQQFLQWQEQLLSNQNVLQGHVNMPLQSLQVLREILPQMKQKLSEDAANELLESSINLRPSTLPRAPRSSTEPPPPNVSATLDRRATPVVTQRFRPPTVNLSTWSERPKTDVIIKQDSDYRIGVGQLQASRTPVVRSAEPKLKETTNLLSGGVVNREVVTRSNSWRTTTTTTVHKPSLVLIQNCNPANATELVRASNKPTVILRHQPMSLTEVPTQQRRYTTLVGVNGAPQPTRSFTNQHRVTQASNPIVKGFTSDPIVKGFKMQEEVSKPVTNKGFKIETEACNPIVKGFNTIHMKPYNTSESATAAVPRVKSFSSTPMPPPPPPPVVRTFTQKKMPPVNVESDRDQLMDAIRHFGGRSNLRKTRPMQM